MKKTIRMIIIGLILGAIDIIPLIFANAPVFNMMSIFAFWLVATFFIDQTKLTNQPAFNGLLVALLMMLPLALAVSATNPKDFIPMMSMALLLGPLCGLLIQKTTPADSK